MFKYILRRVLFFLPVWLGVATAVFLLVRLSGDPAVAILGDKAPPKAVEEFRRREGLDRPLPVQYVVFLADLVRGNLGRSYRTSRPVAQDLSEYFPATVELTLIAMVLAVAAGVALGTVAGVKRNGPADVASTVLALVGVSVPVFWLALVAMKGLGEGAGLLPVGGRLSAGTELHAITGILTLDALLLMASTFVVVNLVVDVLYGILDPRIREGYEAGR